MFPLSGRIIAARASSGSWRRLPTTSRCTTRCLPRTWSGERYVRTHARTHACGGAGPFLCLCGKTPCGVLIQSSAPSSDFLFRDATNPSTFSAALLLDVNPLIVLLTWTPIMLQKTSKEMWPNNLCCLSNSDFVLVHHGSGFSCRTSCCRLLPVDYKVIKKKKSCLMYKTCNINKAALPCHCSQFLFILFLTTLSWLFLCAQIRCFETSYCIDSMGHTNGGSVETGPCHRMGGNQVEQQQRWRQQSPRPHSWR